MSGRPKGSWKVREDEFIELWKRYGGNLRQIAETLGISYKTAQRMKKRLENKLIPKREAKKIARELGLTEKIDDFNKIPEIQEFKKYAYSRLSMRTVDGQISSLRRIWKELEKKRPITWTPEDFWNAVGSMKQRGLKSFFSLAVAFRNFIRFMVDTEKLSAEEGLRWLSKVPTKKLKSKPRLVYLTKEEFEVFVEALKSIFKTPEEKIMIEALARVKVSTGARTGIAYQVKEGKVIQVGKGILGLKLSQIHDDGKVITIDFFEKRNKWWYGCKLSPKAEEIFRKWLEIRKRMKLDHEYVFVNGGGKPIQPNLLTYWFRLARKISGIKKVVTPHTLRKTYLCWLILAGVPLEIAVDLNVGWEDITTAKKYYLAVLKRKKEVELRKMWVYMGELKQKEEEEAK